MKNDRKRGPVKSNYSEALGLAAFSFATCEWNVVWCCERIKPGSLKRFVGDELTAGKIGKRFSDIAQNMPRTNERQQLEELAVIFLTLVDLRNSILHGKPCTGPSGEARLYSRKVIEIADLEDAADQFTDCSIKLNSLLHGFLANFSPAP
jgi:hypothetical protein